MAKHCESAERTTAPKPDLDVLEVWTFRRELSCTMRWERRHQVVVYVHDGGHLHTVKRFRSEFEAGQFADEMRAKLEASRWQAIHAPKHQWLRPR